MEEKLKSILKQIHWSLVLKATIFAVAWFALPFWIFLLLALYLYFVPLGGSAKVVLPFFVLIFVTALEGVSIPFAVVFGILIVVLLFKPAGLLGIKYTEKV